MSAAGILLEERGVVLRLTIGASYTPEEYDASVEALERHIREERDFAVLIDLREWQVGAPPGRVYGEVLRSHRENVARHSLAWAVVVSSRGSRWQQIKRCSQARHFLGFSFEKGESPPGLCTFTTMEGAIERVARATHAR